MLRNTKKNSGWAAIIAVRSKKDTFYESHGLKFDLILRITFNIFT